MADNIKVENTKVLLRDKKSRNRIFLAFGIIFVIVVVGIVLLSSGGKKSKEVAAPTSVGAAPTVASIPGTSDDPAYQSLQEAKNKRDLEAAQKAGTSSVPVLTGTTPSLADPMATTKPTPPPVVAPINPVPTQAPPPLNPIPRTSDVNNNGNGNSARQQQYGNAEKQFNTYLAAFKVKGGSQEFGYYGSKGSDKEASGAASGAAGAGDSAAAMAANAAAAEEKEKAKGATFVRAGTVIPAVLITPVNSDTPGPVLAEITSGPLAGARVLGTFRASRNQVVLTFNQISMLNQPASYKIQAYAVNAQTSAPGLATDVNNHYLAKYGLLAAAEFISGYGQAIANQNTTTVVSPLGGATVVNDGLSNSQISKAALGQVGSRLSSQIQRESSQLNPTIKVEGAHGQGGVPIGLLFMSDF